MTTLLEAAQDALAIWDKYYRQDTLENAADYPDELKAFNELREAIYTAQPQKFPDSDAAVQIAAEPYE